MPEQESLQPLGPMARTARRQQVRDWIGSGAVETNYWADFKVWDDEHVWGEEGALWHDPLIWRDAPLWRDAFGPSR